MSEAARNCIKFLLPLFFISSFHCASSHHYLLRLYAFPPPFERVPLFFFEKHYLHSNWRRHWHLLQTICALCLPQNFVLCVQLD